MASLKLHRLLIAASLLIPVALFLLAAIASRQDALRDGEETVTRTVAVMNEHARKVLEIEDLVLERVDARIHNLTWEEISAPPMGRFLSRLKTPQDQSVAIWISDARGTIRAGSVGFPSDMSIADRDIYKALLARDAGTYISPAFMGRLTGASSFAIGRRHWTSDGHFDGIVHIAASPEYFTRFFATVSDIPHVASLIREDGEILAREPDQVISRPFDPASPLMRAIAGKPLGGFLSATSTLDGVERFYAYSKVGDYPVYVGFGVAKSDMLRRWRNSMMIFGVAAAAAAMTLTLVSWLALRAVTAERNLTQRLRTAVSDVKRETELREVAEQRVRHAVKMEAIGHLTGGIAHDFNNLLMAMLGSMEVLRQRLAPSDHGAIRLLDNALRGVERGTALTQRLLAFGRRQMLRPGPVDLPALVLGMSDLLRSAVGSAIEIETIFPPHSAAVLVDANQLELALLNLASNARDAMAGNGVLTISVRGDLSAPAALDLPPGAYCVLSISDTGFGMDEATVARAVEPFFTTKGVGAGTGLGLSMVHGLAAQSGGKLVLRSKRGVGTTAELWLPRADPVEALPASPAAVAIERRAEPGRRSTVLLVDDDALVLESAAEMLLDLGHAVIEADCGARALEILAEGAVVDLLMTDLSMPGMTGIQLAAEARRLRPGLPVLLATGYAHRPDVIECGLPLLGKPFKRDTLAQAIDDAVAGPMAGTQASPLQVA